MVEDDADDVDDALYDNSARWLLSKGREKEARALMTRFAFHKCH